MFFEQVAARWVAHSPRIRFTLQLAFWDLFKQVARDMSAQAIARSARLLSGLVSRGTLSLGCLKPVDFVRLSGGMVEFLRALFEAMLLQQGGGGSREDDLAVAKVFARVRDAKDAKSIRDGILVFWAKADPFRTAPRTGLLHKRMVIARRVLEHLVEEDEEAIGVNEDEEEDDDA
jgi:hypothetical protein